MNRAGNHRDLSEGLREGRSESAGKPEPFGLSRNDSIGSVVLAASSSARASLFTRYGPSIGPRLALASSCERICNAIPFLPTESFRLRLRREAPDFEVRIQESPRVRSRHPNAGELCPPSVTRSLPSGIVLAVHSDRTGSHQRLVEKEG